MTSVPRPFNSRSLAQSGPPMMRKAFTLLEMLVVIGIITLLAAILIPVVSQVRMRAFVAQTQGEMSRIMAACQAYYSDFKAYPGPLANNMIITDVPPLQDSKIGPDPLGGPSAPGFDSKKITSSENLLLGVFGLLSPIPANPPPPPYYTPPPPKHDVMNLNYSRPASYHYMDFLPDELPNPNGLDYYAYGVVNKPFQTDYNPSPSPPNPPDNVEMVSDSGAPEFTDHIPTPMPILYMRAQTGAKAITGNKATNSSGDLVTYIYTQLTPYGFNKIKTTDYPTPTGFTETNNGWDTYLMNPSILGEPRGKNAFILIDAGPDRIFGTKDDIIVTP